MSAEDIARVVKALIHFDDCRQCKERYVKAMLRWEVAA